MNSKPAELDEEQIGRVEETRQEFPNSVQFGREDVLTDPEEIRVAILHYLHCEGIRMVRKSPRI